MSSVNMGCPASFSVIFTMRNSSSSVPHGSFRPLRLLVLLVMYYVCHGDVYIMVFCVSSYLIN